MRNRASIIVSGRVQGVFFRASGAGVGRELGVTGWIRNRSDGTVELVAEGTREAVQSLINWCRQGPPGSRVDEVKVTWEEAQGHFQDFFIR